MQKMFHKYPQTFDYFFTLIHQGVTGVDKLSKSQKTEAISYFLDEVEEDSLPVWEMYLPAVRLMSQLLKDPSEHSHHLQNDFINKVWENYSLKFKEIFYEVTILKQCPLPHKIKEDTMWESYSNDLSPYGSDFAFCGG